jgi:hypothetical protein
MAVERLKGCDNIVALSAELGVHRLRLQVGQLKRLVADKTLEADFFKGALRKVEARRQSNKQAGETASTTRSGS